LTDLVRYFLETSVQAAVTLAVFGLIQKVK